MIKAAINDIENKKTKEQQQKQQNQNLVCYEFVKLALGKWSLGYWVILLHFKNRRLKIEKLITHRSSEEVSSIPKRYT